MFLLVRRAAAVIAAGVMVSGFAVNGGASAQTSAPGEAGALQAATLREAAEAKGVFVGAAVNNGRLGDGTYSSIASTQFSSVTAENAMKWDATEPSRGSFNYSGGDRLVEFARANDQQVYGHTLVWHSQLPSWVSNGGLSAGDLRNAMNNHITNLANHYEGSVAYWDVVNEAFDEDGSRRDNSVFQRTLGDGYIAEAFRTADAADPNAKLCINDYNIEGINAKSDGLYNLVRSLLSQGVPIDCVGFQSHLILDQIPSSFQANLQRFADLGLELIITELDIRMRLPADAAKLERQGQQFASVTRTCLAVSACAGITVWGVSDRDSWVPGTFPGEGAATLYDENLRPKPAFNGMLTALGGTTGPGPDPDPASCTANYTVTDRWNSGSVVRVTVTTGASLSGWTVTFALPAGSVTGSWNAQVGQSGTAVTATNASHNSTVAVGGSFSFGFQTNSGATYTPPTVSLNGTACAPA
ncbi:endo-1,4-beta-xylanase [Streptomyces sp. 6N223]|uniref:endo-1,4-beta-xylanase n=1 Tax=Streptomyces sp. 6N223 TaxID=3457412 RepID=UPI003FD39A42